MKLGFTQLHYWPIFIKSLTAGIWTICYCILWYYTISLLCYINTLWYTILYYVTVFFTPLLCKSPSSWSSSTIMVSGTFLAVYSLPSSCSVQTISIPFYLILDWYLPTFFLMSAFLILSLLLTPMLLHKNLTTSQMHPALSLLCIVHISKMWIKIGEM